MKQNDAYYEFLKINKHINEEKANDIILDNFSEIGQSDEEGEEDGRRWREHWECSWGDKVRQK